MIPSLDQSPWLYLSFASLHLLLGHWGASLVYWIRFKRNPLVLYKNRREKAHARITQWIAAFSFLWAALFVASSFSDSFRSSFWGKSVFLISPVYGWIIAWVGLAGMCFSQMSMGEAFRIGQEHPSAQAPLQLWQKGLHRWMRHPIYVFSFLCLAGMTLWHLGPLLIGAVLLIALQMHRLAQAEENFLRKNLGDVFEDYTKRVPQYGLRFSRFLTKPENRKIPPSGMAWIDGKIHLTAKELESFRSKNTVYILAKTLLLLGLWVGLAWLILKTSLLWLKIPLWMLLGFFINGLIQLGHEAWHHNLFRQAWANHCFGHLLSLPFGIGYIASRHGHLLHHRYNRTEKDPDAYQFGKRSLKLTVLYYLIIALGLPLAVIHFNFIYPFGFLRKTQLRRHLIALAGMAVFYFLLYQYVIQPFHLEHEVLQGWLVPILFAGPWNGLKSVSDHYGNVWKGNRFQTATTIRSNRFLSFFWNGLNYHLDHHLFPSVPGQHLPELHRQIRQRLLVERSCLFESYFSVWWKALKEGPVFID